MGRIVLLGSSLAACKLGFNWTTLVQGHRISNYGINGALIPDIKVQLTKEGTSSFDKETEPVLGVILIIGGNDVKLVMPGLNKAIAESMEKSRKGLPPMDENEFVNEFKELLDLIRNHFGQEIPIAVVNMKHSSESKTSKLNEIISSYNVQIEKIVKDDGNYTHLIDLYSAENDMLQDNASDDINWIVDPMRMVSVMMKRMMTFGLWSFSSIGESYGLRMTCDGLHFNETTGTIMANLINDWIITKEIK